MKDNKMKIKRVMASNAHWTINKYMANNIGLDATLLLQHFIDLQTSFFEAGGFYQQQERLIKDLPLTLKTLRTATKVLTKKGFIIVKKQGVPAKNHYTVLEDNINEYLMSPKTVSGPETSLKPAKKVLVPKGTTRSAPRERQTPRIKED